jgi:hypothetical protein
VIQHLLFLREQIAHFDVELTVTDIDLDFSHMRDHVRRIMTGESRSDMSHHESSDKMTCILTCTCHNFHSFSQWVATPSHACHTLHVEPHKTMSQGLLCYTHIHH